MEMDAASVVSPTNAQLAAPYKTAEDFRYLFLRQAYMRFKRDTGVDYHHPLGHMAAMMTRRTLGTLTMKRAALKAGFDRLWFIYNDPVGKSFITVEDIRTLETSGITYMDHLLEMDSDCCLVPPKNAGIELSNWNFWDPVKFYKDGEIEPMVYTATRGDLSNMFQGFSLGLTPAVPGIDAVFPPLIN